MKLSTLLKRCLNHLAIGHKRDEDDWRMLYNIPASLGLPIAQAHSLRHILRAVEQELGQRVLLVGDFTSAAANARQELRFDALCMLVEFNKIEESR